MDDMPRRRRTPFPALWVAGVAAASLIPAAAAVAQPYHHAERSYYWSEAGPDTLSREAWLGHAIKAAMDRGDLDETPGNKALARLEQIHRDDVVQRDATHHRGERIDNAEEIQARLDDLADSVKFAIWQRWN